MNQPIEYSGLNLEAERYNHSVMDNVRTIRQAIDCAALPDEEIRSKVAQEYGIAPEKIQILRGEMGRGNYKEGKKNFPVAFAVTLEQEEPLGQGAEGVVYCFREVISGHLLSVKVMKLKNKTDANLLDFREKIAHLVLGENLSIYRGKGELGGEKVECSDYADGTSLDEAIGNPEFTSLKKLEAALGILKAIQSLKERGSALFASMLVANDMRLENIIVEIDSGRLKFIDHGLLTSAQALMELAKKGYFLGTPFYKAPEFFYQPDPEITPEEFEKMVLLGLSYQFGIILGKLMGIKFQLNNGHALFDEMSYKNFAESITHMYEMGDSIEVKMDKEKFSEAKEKMIQLVRDLIDLNPNYRISLEEAAEKILEIMAEVQQESTSA